MWVLLWVVRDFFSLWNCKFQGFSRVKNSPAVLFRGFFVCLAWLVVLFLLLHEESLPKINPTQKKMEVRDRNLMKLFGLLDPVVPEVYTILQFFIFVSNKFPFFALVGFLPLGIGVRLVHPIFTIHVIKP